MIRIGPDKSAKAGIVLAHGRGGTAGGILDLIAMADLSEIAAVAPEAPGHSWWPTSFLSPIQTMSPFVLAGTKAMMDGVAALEASGIARDRIWLGGFSQGACLALETLARHGQGLAGCFGFSGGLVGTSDVGSMPEDALYGHRDKRFDYGTRLEHARVWMSVHEQDAHIPLRRAQDTDQVFRALGADVRLKVYPGAGHRILATDMDVLRDWLGP
jgi:phospholipase/carboxylesterase